jgi:hypothetical protein
MVFLASSSERAFQAWSCFSRKGALLWTEAVNVKQNKVKCAQNRRGHAD